MKHLCDQGLLHRVESPPTRGRGLKPTQVALLAGLKGRPPRGGVD